MVSSQLLFPAYIESYSLWIKRINNQNLGKTVQKHLWIWNFYLRLLRLCEVKKSFKWLIRHKFPLLRTTPSLIKIPIIQNPSHTSSSKHEVLRWTPCTTLPARKTMAVGFVLKNFKNLVFAVILSDSNSNYWILSTTGNEMDSIKINHNITFWENIGFEITDKLVILV